MRKWIPLVVPAAIGVLFVFLGNLLPRPRSNLIIAGLTGSALWITIAITGGISLAVGVFLYSYLLWRGEQRGAD
jgi:hypothetical protein